MAWKWSENCSAEKPPAIDDTSSNSSVFVRKNFIHIPETHIDEGEDVDSIIPEHWRYQEEIISKENWSAYYSAMVNSANIDYIAMEVGVDI